MKIRPIVPKFTFLANCWCKFASKFPPLGRGGGFKSERLAAYRVECILTHRTFGHLPVFPSARNSLFSLSHLPPPPACEPLPLVTVFVLGRGGLPAHFSVSQLPMLPCGRWSWSGSTWWIASWRCRPAPSHRVLWLCAEVWVNRQSVGVMLRAGCPP